MQSDVASTANTQKPDNWDNNEHATRRIGIAMTWI